MVPSLPAGTAQRVRGDDVSGPRGASVVVVVCGGGGLAVVGGDVVVVVGGAVVAVVGGAAVVVVVAGIEVGRGSAVVDVVDDVDDVVVESSAGSWITVGSLAWAAACARAAAS